MMVPPAFVVSIWLGIWKRVVEPVFEMEKRVEVAKLAVEEEMTKSVGFVYIEALELAAKMESVA